MSGADWYPKNKGKVRGWPRRLRQVERLREQYATPHDGRLNAYGYDTARLSLSPWGDLVNREMPVRLRRRTLGVLLDLQNTWRAYLSDRQAQTGEPFDLMLWVFDRPFSQTQLVAAVGERVDFYRTTFGAASAGTPLRPPTLYDDPAYDLDALTWTPSTDLGWVPKHDLTDDPELTRWVERYVRPRVVSEDDNGLVYAKGTVWIGRLGRKPT